MRKHISRSERSTSPLATNTMINFCRLRDRHSPIPPSLLAAGSKNVVRAMLYDWAR